jgi:alpha-amylase/alpha-mannosidase (GH57 family)
MCDKQEDDITTVINVKRQLENIVKGSNNQQLQNAIDELNRYLTLYCTHNIVRDYIDIHPEASVPIQYCSICYTTFTPMNI